MKTIKLLAIATGVIVLAVLIQFYPWGEIQETEPPQASLGDSESLQIAYHQWKQQQEQRYEPGEITLALGWSKGLSDEVTRARGIAKINMSNGQVHVEVKKLPQDMATDVWLVDNKPAPGNSVQAEEGDNILYLGQLNQDAQGVATLKASFDPATFLKNEVDMIVVTARGTRPEDGGLLYGMPTLFQRLYSKEFRQQAAAGELSEDENGVLTLGPTPAYASSVSNSDAFEELVAQGEHLFFNETFNGNGRTCGTCHPAENNLTIDPNFIAGLPNDNPLFVAEFNPALNFESNGGLRFENPRLMREFGLIVENLDGFGDLANKFTMRGVSHVFAQGLSITPSTKDGSDPAVLHRTGWSGDGAPGSGTLRDFAVGAVIQHTPKTLGRVDGVDFRLPTDAELDALAAFQLSLGRQQELDLNAITFTDGNVATGKALFLGAGKCNRCHTNGGAIVSLGPNKGTNANFNTGVENFTHTADALGQLRPRDGGFGTAASPGGGFGNGTFNIPSIIEAADTAPFFHNNVASTLEATVTFYGSSAFANSPASAEVNGISLNPTAASQIANFLRVLNTLENIRSAMVFAEKAKLLDIEGGKKHLRMMREDTEDGVNVLITGSIHGKSRGQLKKGLTFIDIALNETGVVARNVAIGKAVDRLVAARDDMAKLPQTSAGSIANGFDENELELELLEAESGKPEQAASETPQRFTLHQNFPNPFNPTTEIGFTLLDRGPVKVSVFNSIGQEIRVLANDQYEAGEYNVTWDGKDGSGKTVATGKYLYQLSAGSQSFTRTMTLVK